MNIAAVHNKFSAAAANLNQGVRVGVPSDCLAVKIQSAAFQRNFPMTDYNAACAAVIGLPRKGQIRAVNGERAAPLNYKRRFLALAFSG